MGIPDEDPLVFNMPEVPLPWPCPPRIDPLLPSSKVELIDSLARGELQEFSLELSLLPGWRSMDEEGEGEEEGERLAGEGRRGSLFPLRMRVLVAILIGRGACGCG
jgi:hypothetical protein